MIEEVLYTEPKLILYHNLLTEEECDQILDQDLEFFDAVTFDHKTKQPVLVKSRSNSSCYNIKEYDIFVKEKMLSAIKHIYTEIGIDNFEPIQIQRYNQKQEYGPHHDYFNSATKHNTDNDRIGTLIIYLNDDFAGGETDFPSLGFKIKAKKGMGVLFDYQYPIEINAKTLHAGCPITEGTKNAITAWFHRKPFWGL